MGEDRASTQRHIEDLKSLAAQRHPDQALIKDKLRRTFAHRKMLIMSEPVDVILDPYPILRSAKQVKLLFKLN